MAANAATTAGTDVSNTATVAYSVGGNTQTPIESSPTGNSAPGIGNGTATHFTVDAKLVLTVNKVDTAIVPVSPGQSLAVLTYKVTNNGNAIQGALLSAGSLANSTANPFSSTADNFDSTSAVVHVSANNTQTYNNTNDTATSIPQLAPGASAFVFVTSTIPTARANGDVAVMSLTATVADKGAAATYVPHRAPLRLTSPARHGPGYPRCAEHLRGRCRYG